MQKILLSLLIAAGTLLANNGPAQGQSLSKVDSLFWKDMSYRSIGPSRGGRVTAVEGVAAKAEYVLYGFHRRRGVENNRCR